MAGRSDSASRGAEGSIVNSEIGRRDLLRNALLIVGAGALPVTGAHAFFGGPASLAKETTALLTAVADTIIPATDTPGAAGAGVPAMLDKLLANWASSTQRALILSSLQLIDQKSNVVSGTGFVSLTPGARYSLLSAYDKLPIGDAGYAKLKELVITLYYLSEVGSTVELRYEHSPGAWEPSIPLTSETRAYGGPSLF
jgi:hypothetical protein